MLIIFYCFIAMFIIFSLKSITKQLLDLYSLWFSPLEMYNKTIIRFGFCDMPNYQCLGRSYQPCLRLVDNFYLDIDTSAYHKNLIIVYQ